jgi:hypothetical protein
VRHAEAERLAARQCRPHALEGDQVVGELVLIAEVVDRLAEPPALRHGCHFERPPRAAVGAGGGGEAGDAQVGEGRIERHEATGTLAGGSRPSQRRRAVRGRLPSWSPKADDVLGRRRSGRDQAAAAVASTKRSVPESRSPLQ